MSGSSYVGHNLGCEMLTEESYSHLDESIGRTIARYPGQLLLRHIGFFGYSRSAIFVISRVHFLFLRYVKYSEPSNNTDSVMRLLLDS